MKVFETNWQGKTTGNGMTISEAVDRVTSPDPYNYYGVADSAGYQAERVAELVGRLIEALATGPRAVLTYEQIEGILDGHFKVHP